MRALRAIVRFSAALWKAFNRDNVPFLAAAVSYFAFFSLFPLLLGLIAVAGFVLAPEEASRRLLDFAVRGFPAQEAFLRRVLESVVASRQAVGAFAAAMLLWSGKNLFVSLAQALDLIGGVAPSGGFRFAIKRNLVALAFAVALGGAVLVVGGLYGLIFAVLELRIPLLGLQPRAIPLIVPVLYNVLPVVLVALALVALYRFLPARPQPWQDAGIGALVAAGLWDVLRRLFGWYVTTFGRFDAVYGPATSVIVFLLWLYLSAVVFLLGGEWAALRARRAGRSPPAEPPAGAAAGTPAGTPAGP